MQVSFHMHTPPPVAVPGTIPPRHEVAAPVPYIRLEAEVDTRTGRASSVVDRAATDEDKRRYRREWAAFEAQQRPAAPATKGEAPVPVGPPASGAPSTERRPQAKAK